MSEVCWLVECPKYYPGQYFALCECGCGRHHWTPDVHKATKCASKEEAETMRGGDVNCIAVEHEFGLTLPAMTTTPQELVERLLAKNTLVPNGKRGKLAAPMLGYDNPDGPEAAAQILADQERIAVMTRREEWLVEQLGAAWLWSEDKVHASLDHYEKLP